MTITQGATNPDNNIQHLLTQLLTHAENLVSLCCEICPTNFSETAPGTWEGCFKHLTRFNLVGLTTAVAKFRLGDIHLPHLVDFRLVLIRDPSQAVDVPQRLLEDVIAPFINMHHSKLRSLGVELRDSGITRPSNLVNKLINIPLLEAVYLTSRWNGAEYGIITEPTFPFGQFLNLYIRNLKELGIAQEGRRWKEEPYINNLFHSIPSTSLPLTSLKLGVMFDSSAGASWIKGLLPQLRALWLSCPILDLDLLLQDTDVMPQLHDLLLHALEVTTEYLVRLSRAFPRVQILRLKFKTQVKESELREWDFWPQRVGASSAEQ